MTMEDATSGHLAPHTHHHHPHQHHRRTPNTPREHDIQVPVNIIKTEREVCCSCGMLIQDRYLLKVNGSSWHAACLRCCVCQALLERQPSCFVRGERVYCRADYIRQFGAKCAKCSRTIHASDWVRRAREQVYHLACFACDACKRQLSTGEEFALHENRVLCKAHYLESLDAGAGSGSNDETGDGEGQQKAKTKRVRTTFTEEQLQVLQANFNLDSNPDGQDLERIAQITGLSKRVTQVWFQNSRARQKKYLNNQVKKVHGGVLNVGGGGTPCPGCGVQQLYCLCPASSVHMTMSQVA